MRTNIRSHHNDVRELMGAVRPRLSWLAAAMVAFAALPASAQTTTWTGGSNVTWGTPGNWSNGVPTSSGTAVFSGSTSTQPTDTSVSGTLGLIQFNSGAGAYTLGNSIGTNFFFADGGGITVNAGVTTNQKIWPQLRPAATSGTSTVAITNNGTGLLDLSTFLPSFASGTNSLNILSVGGSGTTQFANVYDRTSTNVTSVVKNGSGTLIILASSGGAAGATAVGYFSGSTTINGGTLQLGDSTALGSGTGSIVFGGGTLRYSGSNAVDYSSRIRSGTSAISIDTAGQSVTFSSALAASNTGGLTKLGSGTLTLEGATANAYTGATTVSDGVLTLNKSSGVVAISGSSLQISGTAALIYAANSLAGQLSNSLAMTISGSGAFNSSSNYAVGQLVPTKNNGFNETISSLTMTGGIFQSGQSLWNIGTGSFTGGQGTIFTQNSGATVNFTTLTLTDMTGTGEFASKAFGVYGNGAVSWLTVGSGGLTLNGSVLNMAASSLTNGTRLVLNGNVTSTGSTASQIAPLTPNTFVGANSAGLTGGTREVQLSGTAGTVTRTITTGGNGADLTIAIPITNGSATTANITKAGLGTLTLSAAATYNGATSVTDGTFRLDSSLLATGTQAAVGSLLPSGGAVTLADATTFSVVGRTNSTATTLTSGSYMSGNSNATSMLATVASTAGLQPGAPVTGTGITNGYVVRILSGSTFVLAGVNTGTWSNQTLTATARNFTTAQTIASLALSSGTGTVNVSNNGGNGTTLTISGAVTGAGGFTKTGDGTLTLSAVSSYSGRTVINAGTLALGSAATFANSPTITVGNAGSSGAVLDLTAKSSGFTFGSGQTVGGIGTINIGAGRTVTSAGIWAPGNSIGSNAVTGNLTLSGTSQFELGNPGTSTTAPGLSDFTAVSGTLTLGGALNLINNAGADGNGSVAGGVYRLFTYGNAVSGSYASVTANPTATTRTSLANITYGGSGTAAGQGVFLSIYNLAAGSVTSGTSLNFGLIHAGGSFTSQAVSIGNTAAAGSFSEGLNASVAGSTGNATSGGTAITNLSAGGSASTITVNLGDTATGGVKNGTVTIDYQSNGATTSGLAAIAAGSQVVNLTGSVFSGTGTWNQASGGSWGSQASNSWTSAGGVAAAPGTFIGYANTDAAIFGNAVTGGTAAIALNGAQVSLASLKFDNATARYVIESGTGSGSLALAAASGKPVVDVVGIHEIAAAINGTNGLEKTGLGKLILSGSSNYSGGTDISAGTLAVNGFLGGAVNVANAAILGGSGSIDGLVTVAAGGILAPGNSPGTLTMNAGLSLDAASILNFELSSTDFTVGGGINDLINVTGNFTLDGILNVTGLGDFSTVADNTKWRLFNYSPVGGFTNGGLTLGTMPSVGSTGKYFQIDTATPGQVNLVIVPEPGAIALAGIGIAAAYAYRRRRVKKGTQLISPRAK